MWSDTQITPKDIVRLISYLNGHGASQVPDDAANAPNYLDCDGDNTVAPRDLLLIITHLNAFGAGEGESSASQVRSASERTGNSSQLPVAGSQIPNDLLALFVTDMAIQNAGRQKLYVAGRPIHDPLMVKSIFNSFYGQ